MQDDINNQTALSIEVDVSVEHSSVGGGHEISCTTCCTVVCCCDSDCCWSGPRVLTLALTREHTRQVESLQCFRWPMICLEEEQCGTVHDLRIWHCIMWLRTFFIVLQWGNVHGCTTMPASCCSFSRLWHLWAWSSRTSCCCISFLFSGSVE